MKYNQHFLKIFIVFLFTLLFSKSFISLHKISFAQLRSKIINVILLQSRFLYMNDFRDYENKDDGYLV